MSNRRGECISTLEAATVVVATGHHDRQQGVVDAYGVAARDRFGVAQQCRCESVDGVTSRGRPIRGGSGDDVDLLGRAKNVQSRSVTSEAGNTAPAEARNTAPAEQSRNTAPTEQATAPAEQTGDGSQDARARRIERDARRLLLPEGRLLSVLSVARLLSVLSVARLLSVLSVALLRSPVRLAPPILRPATLSPSSTLWAAAIPLTAAIPLNGATTVRPPRVARCVRRTRARRCGAGDAVGEGRGQRNAAAHEDTGDHRALPNENIHDGKLLKGLRCASPDSLKAYTANGDKKSFLICCQRIRWPLPDI
jgi:hypothetical protein